MKSYKLPNLAAFTAAGLVHFLADTMPIGGVRTAEVISGSSSLLIPSGYTFLLFGFIAVVMACVFIEQSGGTGPNPALDELTSDVGPRFLLICALNIGWVFAWHYGMTALAALVLFALLLTVRSALFRMERASVKWVEGTFALYLGWVFAALLANLSVLGNQYDVAFSGLAPDVRAGILLLLGAVAAALYITRQDRWVPGVGVLWGYTGVLVRHVSAGGYAEAYPVVIVSVSLAMAIVVGAMIFRADGEQLRWFAAENMS